MPVQVTAQDFYNRLIQSGIINSTGNITFNLNGISIQIESKDSIGNMIQEWIQSWAITNDIYLRANPLTQEFPDFYLSQYDDRNFLEIKSFDFNAGANFDVANFEAYFRSLIVQPKKLDADYLIFAYTINNGVLSIEHVFLKKIWEICTNSANWDLKMQVSHGIVKNIRPISFSQNARFTPFANKVLFLEAIQSVLNQYGTTANIHSNWLNNFRTAYQTATGNALI